MRRRNFLKWSGSAIVLLAGAVFLTRRKLKARLVASGVGRRARELVIGVDPTEGTSTLTQPEEASLLKLAGVVLPSNAGEPVRAITLGTLRWRATTCPGYAAEFRRALVFLDAEARKKYGDQTTFAELAEPRVDALVGALLEGIVASELSDSSRGDVMRLAANPRFLRRYRLRRHVVNEMLEGYYRSPLAWTKLGYHSYPGACAGIVVYSHPPAGAPAA